MPTFTGTSGGDVITPTTVSPGVVRDAALPGVGADTINGNDGDDTLNGGTGGDSISGGAGNDLIQDTPTAATDHAVVDGGLGTDTLKVDGSGATDSGWTFAVGALGAGHADVAGARTGQTFDIDNVNVEIIQLAASHLADHIVINDHSASSIKQVQVDLGATSGGGGAPPGVPDGAADDLTLNTTSGNDQVVAQIVSGDLVLTWNNHKVQVHNLETRDHVAINSGDGDDVLDLARTGAAGPTLMVDAGAGNDTLRAANSVLLGGAGDDTFLWVRDGADTMDGGAGVDVQSITAGGAADEISLSANGGHVSEKLIGFNVDVVGVETINLQTLDRADAIRIGDLTGTDVRTLNIDLAGASGGPDGAIDSLIFFAPPEGGVDIAGAPDGSLNIAFTPVGAGALTAATVKGLDATDRVTFQGTAGADRFGVTFTQPQALLIDTGDGDDKVVGFLSLSTVTAGAGADVILLSGSSNLVSGGDGADLISFGGLGRDVADGGAGDDTMSGAESDLLHGGEGNDELHGGGQGVQLFGDAGNDSLVSGDAHETLSGGDGDDVIQFFSSSTIGFGGAGNDLIKVNGAFSLGEGGAGNDTLTGLDQFAAATLSGGSGDDVIQYTMLLKGKEPALIDGGGDFDRLSVLTDPALLRDHSSWVGDLFANGGTTHVHMTNAGLVASDFDVVETEAISLTGGNGADIFFVENLGGTGVEFVAIDLGGGAADGASDEVNLFGTAGADAVVVRDLNNGDLSVSGLPTSVSISHEDVSSFPGDVRDVVLLRTEGGDDVIDMVNMNFDHGLIIQTGAGNDVINAGFGPAVFNLDAGFGGHDVINHFASHAMGGSDVVDVRILTETSLLAARALGHIFQSGADVVITDGHGSFLTLTNVSLSLLGNADFIF